MSVTNTDPSVIIFRLKNVPFIDITGLTTLCELIEKFHHRGIKVHICEANREVRRKLIRVNILHKKSVFFEHWV